MAKINFSDVLAMPISERIQFVEDVWDSIAAVPEAVPLTDEQREELDSLLEAHHRDPEASSSWEEVKKRIRKRS